MTVFGAATMLFLGVFFALLAGLAFTRPLRRLGSVREPASPKPFSIAGLLGGFTALVLIAFVGDTFGFPGSREYQTYELFNRTMAFILALQASGILAFFIAYHERLTRFSERTLAMALGGWATMAIGTAAEFWLFSSLPYGEINFRSFAFSLFSMGSLVAGLSLFVLSVWIMRSSRLPRYMGASMLIYLPLDIALFVANESIFLAPALGAIIISSLALRHGGSRDVPDAGSA